jgi:hypothetical protein
MSNENIMDRIYCPQCIAGFELVRDVSIKGVAEYWHKRDDAAVQGKMRCLAEREHIQKYDEMQKLMGGEK